MTTEKVHFLHLKKRLRRGKWGEILTANKGDKMLSLFIYLYSASFLKSFQEGIFHKKHIQTDSLKINKGSYIQIGKEHEEAIYIKQIMTSKRMCRKMSNLVNSQENAKLGTSLVVQWLGVRLPMQATRVRALAREDPTCRRAAGPVSHSY